MSAKNHIDLIQQYFKQERNLKLQQSLTIGLRNFALILKSKSKDSMQGIRIYLLEMMQQNLDNRDIVAVCKQMIAMVEEKISKIE
ncbi:hypothetical protein GXP67_31545 [Rhodocytophaga rosea]|uniref:Uncharacterized protein n=1 Tax=Rhodocytophaga rosea TaxID=2704465 RepID=A0A6C0GRZ1_9BACT|nr:hypothetical protein [Rhodocytophaga rosea]QHT70861.1 hypothetical protein GXP67_31545 [Rhodocytophaga rosea]